MHCCWDAYIVDNLFPYIQIHIAKGKCKHGKGNPPVCMQAACMSATLLAACFACTLVHPQRAVDLALYTPLHLWEGVDLFLDPYRCATQCFVFSLAPTCLYIFH